MIEVLVWGASWAVGTWVSSCVFYATAVHGTLHAVPDMWVCHKPNCVVLAWATLLPSNSLIHPSSPLISLPPSLFPLPLFPCRKHCELEKDPRRMTSVFMSVLEQVKMGGAGRCGHVGGAWSVLVHTCTCACDNSPLPLLHCLLWCSPSVSPYMVQFLCILSPRVFPSCFPLIPLFPFPSLRCPLSPPLPQNHHSSSPFLEPVTDKEAPGYSQVVKHPIGQWASLHIPLPTLHSTHTPPQALTACPPSSHCTCTSTTHTCTTVTHAAHLHPVQVQSQQ